MPARLTNIIRKSILASIIAVLPVVMAAPSAAALEIRQQSGVKPLRPATPNVPIGIQSPRNNDPSIRLNPQQLNSGSYPSASHIRWCSDRYRSYRLSDNSYQPNAGTRQSCNSPFQQ